MLDATVGFDAPIADDATEPEPVAFALSPVAPWRKPVPMAIPGATVRTGPDSGASRATTRRGRRDVDDVDGGGRGSGRND